MVLPLLDSPFLSVTQYGECVTGPSRDKKRENLNFTFSKCPPVSFYLILAFSSCLCGGFAVLLSPLQCSACLPSACPGVTISWGSATRKASLQAPPASSLVGWEISGTLASQSGIEKREKTGWIWWWCSTLKSSSLSSGCKPRFHLLMVFCLDSQEQNKKTFSLLRFVIYGFGKANAPLPLPLVWFAFSACLTVLL